MLLDQGRGEMKEKMFLTMEMVAGDASS